MELIALLLAAFTAVLVVASVSGIVRIVRASAATDVTLGDDVETQLLGELTERKEMVMQLIMSTELDHQTSKISDEDRDKTLGRLKREAVALMKQIDLLGGTDEDVRRASDELERFLDESRAAGGDRAWSAAARIRHGGVHPQTSNATEVSS